MSEAAERPARPAWAWLTLPVYAVGALYAALIALGARLMPGRAPRIARALPYRRIDLFFLPLPGVEGTLVRAALGDRDAGRRLIDEATRTHAQHDAARAALIELQARSLEQAARDGAWHAARTLELPFIPALDDIPPFDPLWRFASAAKNVYAAGNHRDQRKRRTLLHQALDRLESQSTVMAMLPDRPDPRQVRMSAALGRWRQAIEALLVALDAEVADRPQVPRVFVTGQPLDPSDPDAVKVFRARKDLLRIIEHDLADDRRGVLLLLGQRRMGKTSLLRMLPAYLGDATTVITLDFQRLSGMGYGEAPQRWVADAIHHVLRIAGDDISDPPATDAWAATLSWLEGVEATLERGDRRLLVAIDEVERVQDGIDEGWSTPAFLDFLRAAGDGLRRIRLLLVSAHPPTRLGPAWTDRLISAQTRWLGPLAAEDARSLLRRPVPDFPDVFDDAAIDAALAQTGGHPFLINLIGDEVVARLNEGHRRTATARDIERAIDGAMTRARQQLFPELWRTLGAPEQAALRAMVAGVEPDASARRQLEDQGFVTGEGDRRFAFPLFARWIGDYAQS